MFRLARELTEWGFYLPAWTLDFISENGFSEWEYNWKVWDGKDGQDLVASVVIWKNKDQKYQWVVNDYRSHLGLKREGVTTTLRKAMIETSNLFFYITRR